MGIVATNALELGVDIGVLDAVIMLGFPLGLANFRQQIGLLILAPTEYLIESRNRSRWKTLKRLISYSGSRGE